MNRWLMEHGGGVNTLETCGPEDVGAYLAYMMEHTDGRQRGSVDGKMYVAPGTLRRYIAEVRGMMDEEVGRRGNWDGRGSGNPAQSLEINKMMKGYANMCGDVGVYENPARGVEVREFVAVCKMMSEKEREMEMAGKQGTVEYEEMVRDHTALTYEWGSWRRGADAGALHWREVTWEERRGVYIEPEPPHTPKNRWRTAVPPYVLVHTEAEVCCAVCMLEKLWWVQRNKGEEGGFVFRVTNRRRTGMEDRPVSNSLLSSRYHAHAKAAGVTPSGTQSVRSGVNTYCITKGAPQEYNLM